jgi:hypothetical protein
MTSTTIQRVRALGLTVERFGALTGYHPITIYNWHKPRNGRVQEVPSAIQRLLEAWEAKPDLIPKDDDQDAA